MFYSAVEKKVGVIPHMNLTILPKSNCQSYSLSLLLTESYSRNVFALGI